MSTTRDAVMAVLRKVGRIRGIDPADIQSATGLVDIGYQSLDLAQIVALLEQRLGVDPFEREPITDVRTAEDLCAAYERALADEPTDPDHALASGRAVGEDQRSRLAERRRASRDSENS